MLADVGKGADRGGGTFAFATARGIRALLDLLERPQITLLKESTGFELIVGMDAITDERALDALTERLAMSPGLTALALVHGRSTLFHPKFCWFEHGDRVTLIVGSGNLTPGGLTRNFEAFAVVLLDGDEAVAVLADINAWRARWQERLFTPDAQEAIDAAKTNSGAERSIRRPMSPEDEASDEDVPPSDDAAVLVLEIPRNAPGRTQLDVGLEHFQAFFGGKPGHQKQILIQHQAGDGKLDPIEPPRPLIETSSRNYRFEAAAGRDVPYPTDGRPVGVFVHMPDGVIRYTRLWPGDPGYSEVENFLTGRVGPAGRRIRREAAEASELLAAWPGCPFA